MTALVTMLFVESCARPSALSTTWDSHAPPLSIELLSVRVVHRAPIDGAPVGRARFRIRNVTSSPVQVLGDPVHRLAVRYGVLWVEEDPLWLSSGAGRFVSSLEPFESREIEVDVPAGDTEFRVGVGAFSSAAATPPPWDEWQWRWSSPLVLANPVRRSELADGR